MSDKLPVVSGKELIKLLEKIGFAVVRIIGSHHREHSDGRITTIPVHKNDAIPKGLLRKILREDVKVTPDDLRHLF